MAKTNGTELFASWQQQLLAGAIKHGPWAIMAVVLAWAFYVFTLTPLSVERETLLKVLQENVRQNQASVETMAAATRKISDTLMLQQQAISKLSDTLDETNRQNKETADTLKRFSSDMIDVHPRMEKTLNDIKKALPPPGGDG